ncbi:DUF6385 domain-containing protein [Effusibacillus consociatus]|uniref:DUF6385 domain-containing protein n=1 Tax=Effusibacillus consociatus TaxID=1117041 RepID=A0ABV9Q1L3_9BACL
MISTVTNLTAACLVTNAVTSNLTAACLIATVTNLTAACLISTVTNLTAACMISTVTNLTAACLLANQTLVDRAVQDATTTAVTTASTSLTPSTTRNVLTLSQFSLGVSNSCATGLVVQLQISPDNVNFTNDTGTFLVPQNDARSFTPSRFAKYARLQYAAQTAGCTVTFVEFFQGQV